MVKNNCHQNRYFLWLHLLTNKYTAYITNCYVSSFARHLRQEISYLSASNRCPAQRDCPSPWVFINYMSIPFNQYPNFHHHMRCNVDNLQNIVAAILK